MPSPAYGRERRTAPGLLSDGILRLLRLAIRFTLLLFVDGPVALVADTNAAARGNEHVWQFRDVRGVATQARHLLARMQRVRNSANRMRRPGMPETQAGIEVNFGGCFELCLRD